MKVTGNLLVSHFYGPERVLSSSDFCLFSELSECVKGILGELSVYQAVTSLYPSQAKTNHRSAVTHIAFTLYR
jgi:hypothetical protein